MKRLCCLFLTGILALGANLNLAVLAQNITGNNLLSSSYTNRPGLNLADNIITPDSRPILKELVIQAGLLSTLSGTADDTFFAPTEEALKEIQYDSSEKLRVILLNHVVSGTYKLNDLQDGMTLTTLAGETITIFRKKDQVLINGVPVVMGNNKAKNGMMHNIGDILKPKSLE